jgi:antitoxin MazE
MKTRIVRIGNSQGIRIPKLLLEQTGLKGEVEITIRDNALIVQAAKRPRAGWSSAFAAMAAQGDDALVDGNQFPSTSWDEEEWEWQ